MQANIEVDNTHKDLAWYEQHTDLAECYPSKPLASADIYSLPKLDAKSQTLFASSSFEWLTSLIR